MGYFTGFKEEITGLSYAVMGWIPSGVMEHGWKFLQQNGISMGKSSINIYKSGISNCHIRSKLNMWASAYCTCTYSKKLQPILA
jgi:hypothetical protein